MKFEESVQINFQDWFLFLYSGFVLPKHKYLWGGQINSNSLCNLYLFKTMFLCYLFLWFESRIFNLLPWFFFFFFFSLPVNQKLYYWKYGELSTSWLLALTKGKMYFLYLFILLFFGQYCLIWLLFSPVFGFLTRVVTPDVCF